MTKKLVIGITGASGVIIGVRLLEALKNAGVESHLIISKWGRQTLGIETRYSLNEIKSLATSYYSNSDMGATISSGSFLLGGMVIIPCSMRTLASIAVGYGSTLIHRAADVCIKERRKLVLMPREMPFSSIHLENMLKLSNLGVTIMPPVPAFYNSPKKIDDIINHFVSRTLDQFDIGNDLGNRWQGKPKNN